LINSYIVIIVLIDDSLHQNNLRDNTLNKLQQIVDTLDYDYSQFSLPDFTDHVAGFVRQEIIIVPWEFEKDLFGLWINTTTSHYVFFNDQLHATLQFHTILHEFAHIVLEHEPKPIGHYIDSKVLEQFQLTQTPLGKARTNQQIVEQDKEEHEAEEFVFLVQSQLIYWDRTSVLFGRSNKLTGLRQFTRKL